MYPDIVSQYTQPQSFDNQMLIDPARSSIASVAEAVFLATQSTNSFHVAKALFIWLKENIQYKIHTENNGVQPAVFTLQKKTGDCDDLSFLYISLCRSLGIPARFIRGYLLTDAKDTAMITPHAWVEVFVGESVGNHGWIPVECACCTKNVEADVHQNFGVEDAFHLRLFVDDGSNESLNVSFTSISYSYHFQQSIKVDAFSIVNDYEILESKNLIISNDETRTYE